MRDFYCPSCNDEPLTHPHGCEWKFFCPGCFELWAIIRLTETMGGIQVLRATDFLGYTDAEILGNTPKMDSVKGVSL